MQDTVPWGSFSPAVSLLLLLQATNKCHHFLRVGGVKNITIPYGDCFRYAATGKLHSGSGGFAIYVTSVTEKMGKKANRAV